jgi:hypothetical protein
MITTIGDPPNFPIPQSHDELRAEIQKLEALDKPAIPEKRLQEHIRRVVTPVMNSILEAVLMQPKVRIDSLALVARFMTLERDTKTGQINTERETMRVIHGLGETITGRKTLLRVVHAISLMAIHNLIPFPTNKPSLPEIYQATMLFAAHPLLVELSRDADYVQAGAAQAL